MKNPPPCPGITQLAVEDLEVVIASNAFIDLEIWISEIERFCSAIDESSR